VHFDEKFSFVAEFYINYRINYIKISIFTKFQFFQQSLLFFKFFTENSIIHAENSIVYAVNSTKKCFFFNIFIQRFQYLPIFIK
jgi:hypothetical protein